MFERQCVLEESLERQGFNINDFIQKLSIQQLEQLLSIIGKQKQDGKHGNYKYIVKPYADFDPKLITLKDYAPKNGGKPIFPFWENAFSPFGKTQFPLLGKAIFPILIK